MFVIFSPPDSIWSYKKPAKPTDISFFILSFFAFDFESILQIWVFNILNAMEVSDEVRNGCDIEVVRSSLAVDHTLPLPEMKPQLV